jgi:hypothetical protein
VDETFHSCGMRCCLTLIRCSLLWIDVGYSLDEILPNVVRCNLPWMRCSPLYCGVGCTSLNEMLPTVDEIKHGFRRDVHCLDGMSKY